METVKTENGEIWAFAAKGSYHVGFAICALCGSAVPNLEATRKKHGEWHEKLRRAVDETEMLGRQPWKKFWSRDLNQ